MSSLTFNPLEQRVLLPTLLNWKGAWNNVEQYYKNDVAIDPSNQGTYLCISNTSLDQQPISNTEWFEFFPHRIAIDGIASGNAGIGLLPPATNPTIVNTGVRAITSANGIGSATIGQVTEVFNLGLRGIIDDVGISSEFSNGTLTILNNGVLFTSLLGFGNTGTPQAIQLSNQGILQITAGAGIGVSVDASNNYTLSNTYVTSIGLGAGLFNVGDAQDQEIVAIPEAPYLDVLSVTGFASPNPIPFGSSGLIPVSLLPNSRLESQLQNGSSDANPYWLMDLNGIYINLTSLIDPNATVSVGVYDGTTPGGPYSYLGNGINGVNGKTASSLIPFSSPPLYEGITSLGYIFMNPNGIRSAGLKTITHILIRPNVPSSPPGSLVVTSIADVIQMGFYPNVAF
jgi:hypothetical protein